MKLTIFKFISIFYFTTYVGSGQLVRGANVPFSIANFEEAESLSQAENKPLLIDFYANWCSPCKWMDETTFKDGEVYATLSQKFITIKINIDDIDGFAIKNRFDVKILPTILILNDKGRVIERVEETLGIPKMLGLLQNVKMDFASLRQSPNTNPKNRDTALTAPLENNNTQVKDFNLAEVASPYRMQMGVFTNYDGASQLVTSLTSQFMEPLVMIQETKDSKTYYKVLMGEFYAQKEAESYKKMLMEKFKMDAIIQ